MKYIKSDHGYALLLTLLILIVFTVLGMSVLGMSLSGKERNNTREEIVQANDLAAKGIDNITAQITNELNTLVSNTGISAESYLNGPKGLKATINKYKCVGGTSSITQNATQGAGIKYTTCIDKIEIDSESKVTINNNEEHLRRILTFKSIGISGDKTEILYSKYNIGATQYPEVLNYAVGAYKVKSTANKDRFPNLPGEGNLYLNGGVNIKGDVKVDNNLIVSEKGIWKSGSTAVSEESWFPEFSGYAPNSKSKIFMGGNLYHFNYPSSTSTKWSGNFTYENYLNESFLGNSPYYANYSDRKDLFFNNIEPVEVARTVDINPIDFNSKYNSIYFSPQDSNSYDGNNNRTFSSIPSSISISNTYLATSTDVKVDPKCNRNCTTIKKYNYTQDYTLNGTNIFGAIENKRTGKFGTLGNLSVSGPSDITFNNGAYIGGNLNITGNTEIKGTIFVEKNLTISNANLKSDVIFYVNGDVKITESTIAGVIHKDSSKDPLKNRTGSLIIFTKGNVQLSNNSEYEKEPSDFKAYFYSEKNMEIFGIGSNVKINGGISARKIILNAVKGETTCNFLCRIGVSDFKVESKSNQKNKPSRLQIIYDPEIIKTFSELDIQTEPWIDNISPPVELERSSTPSPN